MRIHDAYICAQHVRHVNVEGVHSFTLPLPPMDESAEAITGRVRTLRKRAGLSLADFAKELGMAGASSIQRYESPTDYRGGYLKRDLVALMERALVRRGSPPISREEVWELAGPEFSTNANIVPNATIDSKNPIGGVKIPLYGQAVGARRESSS